ncbi:MAG: glutamyl-tRNA reductase [Sphingobacteriales bacterium]
MEININKPVDISNFFVAGVNYKKTDAATRGQFSINNDQYENILNLAPAYKSDALFILSTCNRTEIYGFAEYAGELIDLLCTQTTGDKNTFTRLAYIKKGEAAVEHLFNVGAGLDSQILGDYEIIGQLKAAVKFSKERGFINCFLERMVNCVLQSSKTIKNDTALSGGTVSVSFAAVQYIKENFEINADKKILLIGTGKIGRNTCKNLVDYLGTTNITLINRSEDKAAELAAELNLKSALLGDLDYHIANSDIILTATNADQPTIFKSQLENKGSKLIVDLSVPNNVDAAVKELPGITLVNVDELSKLKDETLQRREAETPKAKAIIAAQIADYMEWYQMRKNAPALNAIKGKLIEIHTLLKITFPNGGKGCPVMNAERKIQKVISNVAFKMRSQNQQGCHYLEAINEFMSVSAGN